MANSQRQGATATTTTSVEAAAAAAATSVRWSDVIDEIDSSLADTSFDSGSSSEQQQQQQFNEDAELNFLCELVGARNLCLFDDQHDSSFSAMGDSSSNNNDKNMRPYCVVSYGEEVIHRTKKAAEPGGNPIWTVSTKSLFLFKATPKDMSRNVLHISLFDRKRRAGAQQLISATQRRLLLTGPATTSSSDGMLHDRRSSSFLGQVNLDGPTILAHCNEERFEIPVEDELGEETSHKCQGRLALRFRLATESDQQLLQVFRGGIAIKSEGSSNSAAAAAVVGATMDDTTYRHRPLAKLVTETAESEIVQSSFVHALSHVFSSRTIHDPQTGTKRIRVKPGPDPEAVAATEFLSADEISLETRQPSHHWVEAGSGRLGKLYLEILSCHNLPNVDVGEAMGNVTDSFVCAVYEDTVAMTDVIDDELCPHWLPWTQRAFCFGMMHPASILYLGVFDYDLGPGTHEALGRVAVNTCNLQRNTVYTLKYNLFPSSNVTDRTANGSITIRLRIECHDEKAALLAALQPRPKIHVNVQKEKSFRVIRYTCFGEYDLEEKFDLTVTRSYIDEVLTYKRALAYAMSDALQSVIFWRGQVQVLNVLLPLYSLFFFVAATTLVERPSLIVPFTLLSLSMIMMATLTIRRQHPSPWNRCPSFMYYLMLLRDGAGSSGDSNPSGKSVSSSRSRNVNIKEYEGWEAAQAYDKARNNRLEQDRKMAEQKAALQQEIDTIGDENISTKLSTQGAIPLELFNRLGRYQGIIGRLCKKFRFIKVIVTWEESIVSFWLTAGLMAAGLVSLFLPWAFILTWTGRVVAWGLLGPQMKLVDLTLTSRSGGGNKGDGETDEKDGVTVQKLVETFQTQFNLARMRREETVKLKDIKELAFGKYSIQVPSFNLGTLMERFEVSQ
jgi:hypothetical protein